MQNYWATQYLRSYPSRPASLHTIVLDVLRLHLGAATTRTVTCLVGVVLAAVASLNCAGGKVPDTNEPRAEQVRICGMDVPLDIERLDCFSTRDTHDAESLAKLQRLRAFSLLHSRVPGDMIDALKELPLLDELVLGSREVDDEFLLRLGGLGRVRKLHFPRTRITDAGVRTIARTFSVAEELGLCYTSVSNEGLAELTVSRHLRVIRLCGRTFTAPALAALSTIDGLTRVELIDTGISRAAALRFARSKSGVEVAWASGTMGTPELLH